jgi:DNA mismatch repair protein MutL
MPTIRILTDRVANQIAAGEVIERPAAVVKELVENSLDAGATRIEIEFSHGGRSLIRVEDNGCGMTKDDALMSLERHATSKLVETADLDRLETFGFRGEAVPSIASVSRFELRTRPEGQAAGTEIVINGGKLLHVRECGLAQGTRITVSHLFNSVPARRKFLKTDATESAHIIQTVRLYALACPQTAFTLIEDGRVLFQSPICTTLTERVAEIFGRQLASDLLPVTATDAGIRLSGLIGKPGVNRGTRHEMLMFINRRPVDSRTLNYAVIESYTTSLAKGRYPVAILFLELDPAAVDVNVHPAKREVRFRAEGAVRGFVIRALLQCLREHGATASLSATGALPPAEHLPGDPPPPPAAPAPAATPGRPPSVMAQPFRPFTPLPAAPVPARPMSASPFKVPSTTWGSSPPLRPGAPAHALVGWRHLGAAHGDFLLFEAPGGVVVLDRRAAHERVWFERLQAQFSIGEVASQRLLFAVPVELDAIGSALLLDRIKLLHDHGLEVAEFGRHFFRLEAVPVWLDPADAETFLRDLVGLMREGRLDEDKIELAREEVARLAAQKAVRLPPANGETEAMALVADLFACQQPHTSPSGRPTHFEISRGELARRLQR